jgi:hypothetical protein
MEKIEIRKTIARLKKELGSAPDRANVIQKICELQTQLQPENLPTLGQLRRTIEKDIEQEKQKMVLKVSSLDLKRVALKEAILDYYNNLPYDAESKIVEYEGSMRLRRDNQKTDSTDLDFAPDYSEIYTLWMDKIRTLVRHSKLNRAELDEAEDKGMPRGGFFEKQLIRLMKYFLGLVWERK